MFRQKKMLLAAVLWGLSILFTGCGADIDSAFPVNTLPEINISENARVHTAEGYASGLAVIEPEKNILNGFDSLGVGSALLVDDTDGCAIVSYEGHQKIYPASMTKVMSGILIAEALESGAIHMEDMVTLNHNITIDPEAARLDLEMGDTISVQDLVYGFLIRSLNDCGIVLAEKIAGSQEAFVELMNQKAHNLGATNTHFVNCHGLHDEDHYTSAYDLYLFFREFASHDIIQQIDEITSYTLKYTNAEKEEVLLEIKSTNGFLSGEYSLPAQYNIGVWKSGTTRAAGSCLIMQINYHEHKYYAVICKADGRETLYKRMYQLISCIPEP